jgi:putative CocE/NonD family hydrolase
VPRLVIEPAEVPSGGATLVADVYRLDDHVARPCLLQRVPYGRTVPAIANGALDVRRAVEAGFVVMVQDCRGRGDSTGRFVPFSDERRDAVATFDWITDQLWSDGTVGMFGRSYAGLNQWLAATSGHPALRAIAPTLSGGDPLEWLRPGGVFEWGFALWWSVRYLSPGFAAGAVDEEERAALAELAALAEQPAELLRMEPDALVALSRETMPFLADWLEGIMPGADARCVGPVDVPAFVTAGWFDIFARSTLDTYRRSVTHPASRLVIGPWAHGGAFTGVYPDWDAGPRASDAAIDLTGQQLRWYLSVLGNGTRPTEPAVQAFVCGADKWVPLAAWPPAATPPCVLVAAPCPDGALRLRADTAEDRGALDVRVPLYVDVEDPFPTRGGPTFLPGMEVAAAAGPRSQASLADREDVIVISADPFDAPTTIIGDVRVDVTVDMSDPSTAAGIVCVRLCDRSPDGTLVAIGEGAASVPHTVGTHRLDVGVGPCGWQLERGHALVLTVSRASSPRFEPPRVGGAADIWLSGCTVRLPPPTTSPGRRRRRPGEAVRPRPVAAPGASGDRTDQPIATFS